MGAVALATSLTFIALAAPATARLKAADYLIAEQIREGCAEGRGTFDERGIYEIDLDGDGRDDLLLAHEALECEGAMSRSLFCGAQVCSILVYIRDGALLKQTDEALGLIVEHDPGPPPTFKIMNHGGATSVWTPGRD
jgi:hypothetical protein